MTTRRGNPDVLVVGAGPAGSALGGILASRGWRVTLLDRERFPRTKPCGESVNPGARRILRRLDLLEPVLSRSPSPLEGWTLRTEGGARAEGSFGDGPGGLGISRESLDTALVREAVRRGARLEEGVRVLALEPATASRAPRLRVRGPDGKEHRRSASLVVGADGLRSVVSRELGAHRRRPRIHKLSLTCRVRGEGPPRSRGTLFLGDSGVVGLAPVHVHRPLWNGTVVVDSRAHGREVAEDAKEFFRRIFTGAELPWTSPPEVVSGPWASGPFDWPTGTVVGEASLLVGDAAGYYDPLTGQGIRRALRSAELAAEAIDDALRAGRVCRAALLRYQERLFHEMKAGRRLQRLVEGVVSRPGWREAAVSLLGAHPHLVDALIRVTGDLEPVRSLLHPAVWAPTFLPRFQSRFTEERG